jgi:hypothetical protein
VDRDQELGIGYQESGMNNGNRKRAQFTFFDRLKIGSILVVLPNSEQVPLWETWIDAFLQPGRAASVRNENLSLPT